MEKHSSNSGILIKEDFIKYLASHIQNTEQFLSMLRIYIPLLPENHYDTIQKLGLMNSVCIEDSKEALSRIDKLYAKNKQKPNWN